MQLWKRELLDPQGISRRDFLALSGAAAGGMAMMASGRAGASPVAATPIRAGGRYRDDAVTLEWIQSRWDDLGAWGDTVGTVALVTEAKRREALRIASRRRNSKVYNLGEPMYPGIPAFPSDPPRRADYYLVWFDTGAENRFVFQDDRFVALTFQTATQVDELNHPSWDGWFYGGFKLEDINRRVDIADPSARAAQAAADSAAGNYGADSILGGTDSLGMENLGPIVTRGLLFDVLGYKQEIGDTAALSADGRTLAPGYRITIEDLKQTLAWEGIKRGVRPGDVVVIRTGWSKYWADPASWSTYLGPVPGPWLAEAHWLAERRPAIVASDTYALEVFPGPRAGTVAEVHQVLMVAEGIRIGEGFNCEELAADGVYEFMFIDTPYRMLGATCAGNAPAAVG